MSHNSYTPIEGVKVFDHQKPGETVMVETPRQAIDTYWLHSGQRVRYITIDGRDYYPFYGQDLKRVPMVRDKVIEKYGPNFGDRWFFWAIRDGHNVADVFEGQEFRKKHGCTGQCSH